MARRHEVADGFNQHETEYNGREQLRQHGHTCHRLPEASPALPPRPQSGDTRRQTGLWQAVRADRWVVRGGARLHRRGARLAVMHLDPPHRGERESERERAEGRAAGGAHGGGGGGGGGGSKKRISRSPMNIGGGGLLEKSLSVEECADTESS